MGRIGRDNSIKTSQFQTQMLNRLSYLRVFQMGNILFVVFKTKRNLHYKSPERQVNWSQNMELKGNFTIIIDVVKKVNFLIYCSRPKQLKNKN